jgi:hypothetical protein
MVPAMSYDTFADAILKKLIREVAGLHRKADRSPLSGVKRTTNAQDELFRF